MMSGNYRKSNMKLKHNIGAKRSIQ